MENWKWNNGANGSKLSYEKDYGFSWPQRNYKCSFCKKEFKSAQALGGHMNVHRRDRARMRLSSPESSPNPNPNATSSHSAAAKFFPYHKTAACNDSSGVSCVSNSSFSAYAEKELNLGPFPSGMFTREQKQLDLSFEKVGFTKARDAMEGDRGKKKKGVMHEVASRKDDRMLKARLDLNMGFVGEAKGQELDLELRLGYC